MVSVKSTYEDKKWSAMYQYDTIFRGGPRNFHQVGGVQAEPTKKWDGSFENPKHMFKLMGKKIITPLR